MQLCDRGPTQQRPSDCAVPRMFNAPRVTRVINILKPCAAPTLRARSAVLLWSTPCWPRPACKNREAKRENLAPLPVSGHGQGGEKRILRRATGLLRFFELFSFLYIYICQHLLGRTRQLVSSTQSVNAPCDRHPSWIYRFHCNTAAYQAFQCMK